jgi:hypothetical protein
VPTAPRFLSATPRLNGAHLEWVVPSNDGGHPIFNYQVQANSGCKDPDWQLPHLVPAIPTAADVGGVTNGVLACFRVRARNAVGFGPWTRPAFATPGVPTAPASCAAVSYRVVSLWFVDIDWTAPTTDGGAPIDKYEIYVYWYGGTLQRVVSVPGDYRHHSIAGLPNQWYYMDIVVATAAAGRATAETAASPTITPSPATVTRRRFRIGVVCMFAEPMGAAHQ